MGTGGEENTKECNELLPGWVRSISEDEAPKREAWPPRAKDRTIPWEKHSDDIYYDPFVSDFNAAFLPARRRLDYSYHKQPAFRRQELQDSILSTVVKATTIDKDERDNDDDHSKNVPKKRPWLVFSAGPMAAGKGYVLSTLNKKGLFPMDRFLKIDPDKLKSELPEMSGYLKLDPEQAATKLHRESTQMADILLEYALQARLPTVVDGSLRDVDYHRYLMQRIRTEFPEYRMAILHVTASPDIIRTRAKSRAKKTGRSVPDDILQESIDQVPRSVQALSPLVDRTFTISNEDDRPIELVSSNDKNTSNPAPSWEEFRNTWWPDTQNNHDTEDNTLPNFCENQCPGICNMEACYDNGDRHQEAELVWLNAYPSFCPRCTVFADSQCGQCIHDRHSCACDECA